MRNNIRLMIIAALAIMVMLTTLSCADARYEKEGWVMKARMQITVFAPVSLSPPDWNDLFSYADDQAFYYDHRIADSPLALLNASGSGKLPERLYAVIGQAYRIAELSNGAFDPTVFPLMELWAFGKGGRLPSDAEIRQAVGYVGYKNIRLLPDHTVRLLNNARLDLGGIGQGAVVDAVSEHLSGLGYTNYLVEASGDILVCGLKPGNLPWSIAIRAPRREGMPVTSPDFASARLGFIGKIEIGTADTRMAVVTSGDYENRFVKDGRFYHHILDPATGYPARGAASATVIAPTCIEADALATTAVVLGYEKGLQLLENLPNVEGLIIREKDGKMEMNTTSGFPAILPVQPN